MVALKERLEHWEKAPQEDVMERVKLVFKIFSMSLSSFSHLVKIENKKLDLYLSGKEKISINDAQKFV